jgi:hypothetical protein
MSLSKKMLIRVAALVVLATVFAMYVQPDFMVQMANQVWSCF